MPSNLKELYWHLRIDPIRNCHTQLMLNLWYKLVTGSMPHARDTRFTHVSHTLKSAMKHVHIHGHACTLVYTCEDLCTRVAMLAYSYKHAYQFEAYMCDITIHI